MKEYMRNVHGVALDKHTYVSSQYVLDRITITNAFEAKKLSQDKDTNFVINVTEPYENGDADIFMPITFQFTPMHFIDIPEARLNLVNEAIMYGLNRGKHVVVHCTAGLERSPLTVIWYLYCRFGLDLKQAYLMVKERYPKIFDRTHWVIFENNAFGWKDL